MKVEDIKKLSKEDKQTVYNLAEQIASFMLKNDDKEIRPELKILALKEYTRTLEDIYKIMFK